MWEAAQPEQLYPLPAANRGPESLIYVFSVTHIFQYHSGSLICISWNHQVSKLGNRCRQHGQGWLHTEASTCLTQQVQLWPLQSVDSGQNWHSLSSVTIPHPESICAIVLSRPRINSMFAWRSKCLLFRSLVVFGVCLIWQGIPAWNFLGFSFKWRMWGQGVGLGGLRSSCSFYFFLPQKQQLTSTLHSLGPL